jgi:very-short-patch-repair endonuclease
MQYGIEILRQKAESEFEIDVGERIIRKGYKVIPQFKPLPNDFNYRIDLVIQEGGKLIAIECDGEKSHGPDRWEYDQRRETQLRRVGWKFWRISGSAFYRNKESAMESLWNFLNDEGIRPIRLSGEGPDNREEKVSLGEESRNEPLTGSSFKKESAAQGQKEKYDKEGFKESKTIKETEESASGPLDSHKSIKPNDRISEIKELIDLINNWKVWQDLVNWGQEAGCIDSHSRAISWQVIDKLKLGRKIPHWLRNEMMKIWKTAIKKGFKPKI